MKTTRGYDHAEAYCLMKYASISRTPHGLKEDGRLVEYLWNSRDGVTPMYIRSRSRVDELMHTDWQRDKYEPNYVPAVGQRIFIDMTREKAREYAATLENPAQVNWVRRDWLWL